VGAAARTPLMPDDRRPLGDTPEAHDEISPHDLPRDHPGRRAAERHAARRGGLTRGDQERVDAAPRRKERLDRDE
jgi:hypothetical protein